MCGILGYIGNRRATGVLIDGLKKLEYRGYDSAGVAVLSDGRLQLRRSVGKLSSLEALLRRKPLEGSVGLGHTRWATHGAPSELNAHPHIDAKGRVVVVHNGIIENYQSLKAKLQARGYKFRLDTDTEVVAHLIGSYWSSLSKRNSKSPKDIFIHAVEKALRDARGTFALGVMCLDIPDLILGARRDCPLIVGLGDGENFLASDVPAVLSYTRNVMFLEDGDLAILSGGQVTVLNEAKTVNRPPTKILWDPLQAEKAGYPHFMLKEIHEQPRTVEDTILGRLQLRSGEVDLKDVDLSEKRVRSLSRVRLIGCGTSWHAALVGSYLIEKYTGLPCQADIASEFRYRDPTLEPRSLVVAISQSGETADTLAAVRLAKRKGAKVLAVANVVGSSITREAHSSLLTHCGPEIGVASTKAFTGQLVAMHLLALYIAKVRKSLPPKKLRQLGQHLVHLPKWISAVLDNGKAIMPVAKHYRRSRNFLYIGRNLNYPIAMEGALKLKEISYVHAEGYPAGEMKHGPIALIEKGMPIVAVVTKSSVYEKMLSNIEEARSRGAEIIAIATKGDRLVREKAKHIIYVPDVPEDFSPLINVIPLQLLAYHIAVMRGCDVDQPRNLAKSVTVE